MLVVVPTSALQVIATSVSVCPYEPCLDDSEGSDPLGILTPQGCDNPHHPFLEFPKFSLIFDCGSLACSCELQEEACLMVTLYFVRADI